MSIHLDGGFSGAEYLSSLHLKVGGLCTGLIDGQSVDVHPPQETQTRQLFSIWARHIAFLLLFPNCWDDGVPEGCGGGGLRGGAGGGKKKPHNNNNRCSLAVHKNAVTVHGMAHYPCIVYHSVVDKSMALTVMTLCYSKHKALRQSLWTLWRLGALRARLLIARRTESVRVCVSVYAGLWKSFFIEWTLCFPVFLWAGVSVKKCIKYTEFAHENFMPLITFNQSYTWVLRVHLNIHQNSSRITG